MGTRDLVAVALLLVVVSCGDSTSTVPSSVLQTTTTVQSLPPVADSSESVATSSPTQSGALDLGGFDECREVVPFESSVQGKIGQTGYADDEALAVIQTYGAEQAAVFGGLWIDRSNGGAVVVAFVDDPEPHLTTLLERAPSKDDLPTAEPRPPILDPRPLGERPDFVFDVLQVRFAESELLLLQRAAFDRGPAFLTSTGLDTRRNRIALGVIDPSSQELVELADHVGAVEAFCLEITRPIEIADGPLAVLPRPGFDHLLTCGNGTFKNSALENPRDLATIDHPAVLAMTDLIANGVVSPASGWFPLVIGDDYAQFGNDSNGLTIALLQREAETWPLIATSSCMMAIGLPPGLGRAEVALDPDQPSPGDTSVHLLVTEVACANGDAPGDRLRPPEVVESSDQVLVAFAVETLGAALCPGNPATPVTIELKEPLGSRQLLDGLQLPAVPIS